MTFEPTFSSNTIGPTPSAYRTFQRVESIVGNIKYKPGFTLRVRSNTFYLGDYSQCAFEIDMKLDDSTGTSPEKIHLTFVVPFRLENFETVPEHVIVDFILHNVILAWESHEAREWFKYRGALVSDPHAQEKAASTSHFPTAEDVKLRFHLPSLAP